MGIDPGDQAPPEDPIAKAQATAPRFELGGQPSTPAPPPRYELGDQASTPAPPPRFELGGQPSTPTPAPQVGLGDQASSSSSPGYQLGQSGGAPTGTTGTWSGYETGKPASLSYTPPPQTRSFPSPSVIGGIVAAIAALAVLYFTGVIGGGSPKAAADYFVPVAGYEYVQAPEGFDELMNQARNQISETVPGFGDQVEEISARSINQNGTFTGIMIVIVASNPEEANSADLSEGMDDFQSGFGAPGRIENMGGKEVIVADQAGQTAFVWVQDGALLEVVGPRQALEPFVLALIAAGE